MTPFISLERAFRAVFFAVVENTCNSLLRGRAGYVDEDSVAIESFDCDMSLAINDALNRLGIEDVTAEMEGRAGDWLEAYDPDLFAWRNALAEERDNG